MNGDERVVCREAFINIHGITTGRVQHLAFYAKTSPTPPLDKRGKHANPHATSEEIKQQIHRHIKSFPTIESHYGRSNTSKGKKYLSPQLSVTLMHELYLEMHEPQEYARIREGGNGNPQVKYDFYREYFNSHFNLSFGVPKTDTCATCDELNVKINDASDSTHKERLQTEKQAHIHAAQEFYTQLRSCTEMARQSANVACLTFDFEQNLPLPHIPTGDIFYLRQLWVYVFGIHDCCSNNASMYVWPESIAHRGSNEVASCLHNYFQNLSGIDTLFLFSDSCPGQNKNYTIIHYLYSLVKMGLFQRIQHIFPIRGHSFSPSDRDFAKTESKKKKVDRLYIPDHWIDVIRSARKVKPFTVVPVSQELVYDFQSHLMPFFKKSVPRMRVHDVRVFEYALSHQNEVWVKYSLAAADEWHRFIVEKKSHQVLLFL